MILQILIIASLNLLANAQSCPTGVSNGPCLGELCPDPLDVCVLNGATSDDDQCCPVTSVVPATTPAAPTIATTTAAAVTATTDGGVVVTVPTTAASGTATTAASTTGCVDKVNPSTGVSDCPARISLCNDTTYYAVMTEQCPQTCGRCTTTTTNTTACVDLLNPSTGVSDCPSLTSLCTNPAYVSLMIVQCPLTCGLCGSTTASSVTTASTATTAGTGCVDQVNPTTGVSECPGSAALCQQTGYVDFMRTQCPLTCGYCSG